MSDFKVGDRVHWSRAVEWKLKDTTGIVKRIFTEGPRGPITYEVEFPFGTLHLHASQITLQRDLNEPERNA